MVTAKLKTDSLKLISKIINADSSNAESFYFNALQEISNVVPSEFSGFYFLSGDSRILKSALKNGSKTDLGLEEFNENILFQADKRTFELNTLKYSNVIISKLLIKNSLFGFAFFAKNSPFDEVELETIDCLVSVYSYLIKDYELSSVSKMQLNLLQTAIFEKDSSYKIIEKQHKKLLELDKAKTSFLANVSHELRTPLNSIIGFSDALVSKVFGSLNDKQEEFVKDIHTSSLHLLGLINGILDISKIESGSLRLHLQEVNPKQAIEEVIKVLTPLCEAKFIKIVFECSIENNIFVDYQKFQQILYNLIGNAVKFSYENGIIIVRAKEEKRKFILEVEDTGVGIDKKFHNKIFKKFTQLDNVFTKTQGSTGLGLTITKELVKLHGGKIYVVSESNKGSNFIVEINQTIK